MPKYTIPCKYCGKVTTPCGICHTCSVKLRLIRTLLAMVRTPPDERMKQ